MSCMDTGSISFGLFNRRKSKLTGTGRNPEGPRKDCTEAVSTKQQPGLSSATSQAASKIHVRAGLNTEGARLTDCDIIPQEKWGKPHCANHFNQDLPSSLETSMQEKPCSVRPGQRPPYSQSNVPGRLQQGRPARSRQGQETSHAWNRHLGGTGRKSTPCLVRSAFQLLD